MNKRNIIIIDVIPIFVIFIIYSTLMDGLRYDFLEWHKDILGYYYNKNLIIIASIILFFFCIRIFILKSFFIKRINLVFNIVIYAVLIGLFLFSSFSSFCGTYLTEREIKTPWQRYPLEGMSSAKIGIMKHASKTGRWYDQYIEVSYAREKKSFKFNTFQNNYTIADFYDKYDNKLYSESSELIRIEVFGLEYSDDYLDDNRLLSNAAARRLKKFSADYKAKMSGTTNID